MISENNKLLIIVSSVKDSLTLKLINAITKNRFNYLLLDYDNKILIDPLKDLNQSINKDFNFKKLIFYIKRSNSLIDIYKDCIFLFEFRKDLSRNLEEHELYKDVKKKKIKRFFYNRRSFKYYYFITDDFYGQMIENKKKKIFYQNSKAFLNAIKFAKKYKSKSRIKEETYNTKKKIDLFNYLKQYIKILYYFVIDLNFFLLKKINDNHKKHKKKKIILILPKENNWFLIKTNSYFKKISKIFNLIKDLSFNYEIIVCPHPNVGSFWIYELLKFWKIKTLKNIYSNEGNNILKKTDIALNIGSTALVDVLLSSTTVIEIGRYPRVCKFKKGYFFFNDKNFQFDKLRFVIEKNVNKIKKINLGIPKFSAFYVQKVGIKMANQIGENLHKSNIPSSELKFIINFIKKQYKD